MRTEDAIKQINSLSNQIAELEAKCPSGLSEEALKITLLYFKLNSLRKGEDVNGVWMFDVYKSY
jgi:hypothetical protein